MEALSLGLSLASLALSGVTFWLTSLRKGTVRMTKPTLVFFGPDGGGDAQPKVYLRSLLVSTSKRGVVVENMYVRLRRGEDSVLSSVWSYGERNALVPGGGVFVGPEGVSSNHHFLLPREHQFIAGTYAVEIFARVLGRDSPLPLHSIEVDFSTDQFSDSSGVFFRWLPESNGYHAERRAPRLPSGTRAGTLSLLPPAASDE